MRGFFALSEVQSERPDGMIPKCGKCGLFKTCESPKMKPHGTGSKDILIIGEAPGRQEDIQGRPFVGKSGKMLRETLAALGCTMDRDCVVTNSVICRPPDNATPENKKIGYCRPNLLKTIAAVQPRVVITLGQPALQAVIKEFWKKDVGRMERWVGWQIPTAKFWLCPTYHPAYVMRQEKNRVLADVWTHHLEQAVDIDSDPPETPDYSNIEQLLDEEEIVEACEWFDREGGWLAFDYEANCLKPEYPLAELISCSFSNGKRTIAFPWFGKAIPAVKRVLRSKRTRKIASNIKNEDRWTRKTFGLGVRRWGWDTMLAAHCIDNRPHICSLKFQMFINFGIPSYNWNIEPYLHARKGTHYNRIREIKRETLLQYNGCDSLFEYWLAMKQRQIMGYVD